MYGVGYCCFCLFQSTLPRGSDYEQTSQLADQQDFNPRSLAGATVAFVTVIYDLLISIHAPSRERHTSVTPIYEVDNFNPRSLAGATGYTLS